MICHCIPNALSLLRLLVAPLLFITPHRFLLVVIAVFSDFFDGFLARRWSVTSKLGAVIDPIADKACVAAFSYVYWLEGQLGVFQLVVLLSRDIALVLFVLISAVLGYWNRLYVKAFWCGKIATTLQALIFAQLSLGSAPLSLFFVLLGLAGFLTLPELFCRLAQVKSQPG